MDLVSVIIPTYNRFKYLLNAINSVKNQTYENIEIIVVNDCSKQKQYYDFNWKEYGVTMIHLKQNSKDKFGFPCPGGYQRNFGIEMAKGKYIAFCDDDDIWLPYKIELQIIAMEETGCKMSSTNGLIGHGVYDARKKYNLFHTNPKIYTTNIWDLNFLKNENFMICCTVIINKDIIDKVGKFIIARASEDYDYWLRALKCTKSVFVSEALCYYDNNHGDGRNY